MGRWLDKFIFALLVFLAPCLGALAQSHSSLQPDFYTPGGEQKRADFPKLLNVNRFPTLQPNIKLVAKAIQVDTPLEITRGTADVSLFKSVANSVVLIMTKEGFGSGSLLQDNTIITNHHVVGDEKIVTVIFRPTNLSGKPSPKEILDAQVIKIDRTKDLALLRLRGQLPYQTKAIEISPSSPPDVGSDVAAIGHPTGEGWTFTKGIVSQIRFNYEWFASKNSMPHKATVIQTQTPINPGNSGGPLLSYDGKLVGINSFRAKGSEGLNFAVASVDVLEFLTNPAPAISEPKRACDNAAVVYEGRNRKNDAFMRSVSMKCDGYADVIYVLPDNQSDPMIAIIDLQRTGAPEGIVYDKSRSGKWQASIWDPKLDDTFPLKGLHKDGKLMPIKYENRCPSGTHAIKNLECGR